MARTNRIKSDGDAHYHVMSRTNGKRMLFERGEVKAELVDALRRAAAFSGVELEAYAAMGNHFHAVVKVVKPDVPVDAEELLRRVGALKGERERRAYAERWKRLALAGDVTALAVEQERLRVRMHDVSEFVKTFKEEFDRAYKREREYRHAGEGLPLVLVRGRRAVLRGDRPRWVWRRRSVRGCRGRRPCGACPRRVVAAAGGADRGWEGVLRTASALGDRFRSRRVGPVPVGGIGYATHGWRLAKEAERAECAA